MLDPTGKLIPQRGETGWVEYELARQGGVQEEIRKILFLHTERTAKLEVKASVFGVIGGALTSISMAIVGLIVYLFKK